VTELAAPGATALAGVATVTPKTDGQDRSAALPVERGAGVAICDGVGSLEGSGAVAELCLAHVVEHVAELGPAAVLTCATAAAAALGDADRDGATTLVAAAVDSAGAAYWTLVGNGSVFELEAVDVRGGRARLAIAELALPQVSYDGGRPALRSTLPAPLVDLEVAGGTLLPRAGRSRALLVCSDGIATGEDWREGMSAAGTWVREVPPTLTVVFERLAASWEEMGAAGPQATLDDTLAELLDSGALVDDASAGLVLMPAAGP
jgi:hypothetical protein